MRTIQRAWPGLGRAVAVSVLVLLCGCAARRQMGVPIEDRPTPPAPEGEFGSRPDTTAAPPPSDPVVPPAPPRNAPVETMMSDVERRAALERIAADTTAASAAVRRCTQKTLLPDQESVYETTRSYLTQSRAALARDELWQAESLARKARQLALSLDCR